MPLEPRIRFVDHRVIARPHARSVLELGPMHHDLGARTLERSSHPDVVGMKMCDEHSSHVFHRDARLSESGTEYDLRFLRVHSRVDERIA